MKDKAIRLTDKQRKFVESYMETNNATTAARRAGYAEHSAGTIGYQLLQKADIKSELARLEQKIALKAPTGAILSALEVRQRLTTIAEDDANKPQDRIRALELLGKTLGLFADKPLVEVNMTLQALESASYEDLKELEAKLVGSST